MAKQRASKRKEQTNHDRLFKEFLQRFLEAFLRLFFPAEAARLDFSTVIFPKQELIINLPGQILRITDFVAEVKTWEGQPETIIIHIDVEANKPLPLPRRMFDYYALIRMLQQKPVLPIALVLKPGVGGLKWQTYREELFGREILKFEYGQVGLADLFSAEYLTKNDPVAAALAVLMDSAGESKANLKLRALRTVVQSDLTPGNKLFLIGMVNTYLPRQKVFDAQEEVMEALVEFEKTWLEEAIEKGEKKGRREGRKEGRKEGKQEGQRAGMHTLLLLQLTQKFGELPVAFVQKLNAITDQATLLAISQQLLTAQSLAEIFPPDSSVASVRTN